MIKRDILPGDICGVCDHPMTYHRGHGCDWKTKGETIRFTGEHDIYVINCHCPWKNLQEKTDADFRKGSKVA